jgi:two-component system, cell cycle sensor histidine kinase and response regulator CckA
MTHPLQTPTQPTGEDVRGAVIALLSVVAAVVLTRLAWPVFVRVPYAPLFIVLFFSAYWTTELASLVVIPAAAFGALFIAPPGDPHAPGWAMSAVFAGVALGVNRLVVSRNRVETALRASEAQFRAAWDNVAFGAALLSVNGQVQRINPAMERLLGYPSAAWADVSFAYFCTDDASEERARFVRLMAGEEATYQREQRYRRADGGPIWCRTTMSVVSRDDGRRDGVLMVLEDVTARRKAEDALRMSEHHYRQLFRSNPQAMWVYEAGTERFLAVNEAAHVRYGYTTEEFLRLSLHDVAVHDNTAPLGANRAGGSEVGHHRAKNGRMLDVQVDSSPIDWDGRLARLELLHDVTERTELKEQLNQSQKMEAIGQLAGGVAHDFNNLLTTIQGYADLLLTQIGPDKTIWKDLHEIQAAAMRAGILTHQLLAFSRRHQFDITAVDVNDIVSRLSDMMRRLISADIELDVSLGEGRIQARADVSRVEQVLMNLVVNARDAIGARGPGGRISIRTSHVEMGERVDGAAASYVALEVTDNGAGMDEATKARVFEPFFTTKRAGAGTGLGLAMVYSIVQQCGGYVEVESERGKGSTFRVYLPWTSEAIRAARSPKASVDGLVGSEHVLVVEDSTELRLLAAKVLKRHGYRVSEAATPEEALALTHREDMSIDLLLLDVVLPRMAGPEVGVHLKAAWPHAAVLYMSGYAHDALQKRGISVDEANLMKKPFSAAELLTRIRQLLDHRSVETS